MRLLLLLSALLSLSFGIAPGERFDVHRFNRSGVFDIGVFTEAAMLPPEAGPFQPMIEVSSSAGVFRATGSGPNLTMLAVPVEAPATIRVWSAGGGGRYALKVKPSGVSVHG